MKILITGGTGLIGRAFIERYHQHSYTLLTRDPHRARAAFEKCDLISSLGELSSLDGFDAVINLAGEPVMGKRWSERQKERICTSRWRITEQLVALFAASAKPPGVFLSGSAVGVYGSRGAGVIDEQTAIAQCDFPTRLCAQWEALAEQADDFTRVVLLRTGVVLSARGGALQKMLPAFKCALGGRIGSGEQYMPWIALDDQLDAMDFLLRDECARGAFNLVSPTPQRNRDFIRTLAAQLKRPAVFPVPAALLKILLGESSSLLLDSQRIVPTRLSELGFRFTYPELAPCLAKLLSAR
ncbi:MAG: TIGR01777 family oxidoreductase [Pseudomonadales bacterium]